MAGYSWKLFGWLTPYNNRVGARKLDCLLVRNLEVHIVNTSFLLNASISIVYPFLDAELKKRIHFHGQDWSSLHKYINPEILPKEYGGNIPSLDYDKLRCLIYSNADQLMELFSLGYVDT
ncbi:hypothetical protein L9F63_001562 [Diploptera punctata]|uniref:CRAL-TRIO domain-containing protein n=1 Tax=Diploptera punctata TaxID=6984 RepID=A0AAD8A519_DIPPU|nr:hypothetical protein L9F63_001562 [Diploptera punctata]